MYNYHAAIQGTRSLHADITAKGTINSLSQSQVNFFYRHKTEIQIMPV